MRDRKRIVLPCLLLAALLLTTGCGMSWWPFGKRTELTRSTPEGLYQQGVAYYQDRDYKRAGEAFQRVRELYPLSDLALMAELGIADAHYSAGQYAEAELSYREYMSLHPTNENLPYVMYQIGMSHYNQVSTIDRDLTEVTKALKEFELLVARFPDSRFAFLAEKMIRDCRKIMAEKEFYVGEFYFNIKKYRSALQRFEKVAREYPNLGLDFKVQFYLQEARRRLAEAEAKQAPTPKR